MSDVETPATVGKNEAQTKPTQDTNEGVEGVNEDENVDNVSELKNPTQKEVAAEKPTDDFKDKYYYLAAEFDNANKRFAREKENLIKYGNERILSSLIEVVDNLERTVDALREDQDEKIKNIVSGINMVHKQFLDVLTEQNLKQVAAVGELFDPNFHEAMSQQKCAEKEDGEILMEYQKGYTLNGRLLRASRVVIVNNKE